MLRPAIHGCPDALHARNNSRLCDPRRPANSGGSVNRLSGCGWLLLRDQRDGGSGACVRALVGAVRHLTRRGFWFPLGTAAMAHTWSHEIGSNRVRCSYKQATMVLCTGNVVAALFMLHALLSPLYFYSEKATQPVQSWPVQEANKVRENEAELKRIRDINAARLKAVPLLLIERVKEIQAESDYQAARDLEAGYARQKVAAELAERLKELKNSNNQTSQQALEEWRKKKQEEAKRREEDNGKDAGSGKKDEEGTKEVEEVGWDPVHGAVMEEVDKKDEHGRVDDDAKKNTEIEDLIERSKPFAKECNPEYHTDYAGAAVRWGLSHPTDTAADCCQACHDQARNAKEGDLKCNIWVYCPAEDGCFSPDIYEHKHHECWLKQADEPKLNFKGTYSDDYRRTHPKAPVHVPWISGVIGQ